MLISVRSFVHSVQVCLEISIFNFLAQATPSALSQLPISEHTLSDRGSLKYFILFVCTAVNCCCYPVLIVSHLLRTLVLLELLVSSVLSSLGSSGSTAALAPLLRLAVFSRPPWLLLPAEVKVFY